MSEYFINSEGLESFFLTCVNAIMVEDSSEATSMNELAKIELPREENVQEKQVTKRDFFHYRENYNLRNTNFRCYQNNLDRKLGADPSKPTSPISIFEMLEIINHDVARLNLTHNYTRKWKSKHPLQANRFIKHCAAASAAKLAAASLVHQLMMTTTKPALSTQSTIKATQVTTIPKQTLSTQLTTKPKMYPSGTESVLEMNPMLKQMQKILISQHENLQSSASILVKKSEESKTIAEQVIQVLVHEKKQENEKKFDEPLFPDPPESPIQDDAVLLDDPFASPTEPMQLHEATEFVDVVNEEIAKNENYDQDDDSIVDVVSEPKEQINKISKKPKHEETMQKKIKKKDKNKPTKRCKLEKKEGNDDKERQPKKRCKLEKEEKQPKKRGEFEEKEILIQKPLKWKKQVFEFACFGIVGFSNQANDYSGADYCLAALYRNEQTEYQAWFLRKEEPNDEFELDWNYVGKIKTRYLADGILPPSSIAAKGSLKKGQISNEMLEEFFTNKEMLKVFKNNTQAALEKMQKMLTTKQYHYWKTKISEPQEQHIEED